MASFYCACAESVTFLLPVQFLTQHVKFSCALSYSTTQFGGAYVNFYALFEKKRFCNAKFRNLGLVGVGNYFRRNPKRHILTPFRVERHQASHFTCWFWPYDRSRNKKATRLLLNPTGKMTSPWWQWLPRTRNFWLWCRPSPRYIHRGSSAGSLDECSRRAPNSHRIKPASTPTVLLPLIVSQFIPVLLYRRGYRPNPRHWRHRWRQRLSHIIHSNWGSLD